MPELPEVETIARDLSRAVLVGVSVGCLIVWDPSVLRSAGRPVLSPSGLRGQQLKRIWRHGKNLVLEWSGNRHLILHLGMSGRVLLMSGPKSADAMPHERVRIMLSNELALCFVDPRRFGRVWITRNVETVLGHLGPDALTISADEFCARLLKRARRIKPLLMDQSVLAGVGNIYADEALWRAKIHPLRKSDSLTPVRARRLWRALREVLLNAIRHRGTSLGAVHAGEAGARGLAHFVTPQGDPGRNAAFLKVYGRAGQSCFRCGAKIIRTLISGRSSCWCPRCQPIPEPRNIRAVGSAKS